MDQEKIRKRSAETIQKIKENSYWDYHKYNYCTTKCMQPAIRLPKIFIRCPNCKQKLRTKPKQSKQKRVTFADAYNRRI